MMVPSIAGPSLQHSTSLSSTSQLHRNSRRMTLSLSKKVYLEEEICRVIRKHMKRSGEPEYAFICEDDLKTEVKFLAKDLLVGESLGTEEVDTILATCLKLISILVWIGATKSSKKSYSDIFISKSHSSLEFQLTDDRLPLEGSDLWFLDYDVELIDRFMKEQYLFIPIKIEEDPQRNFIWPSSHRRLPWAEQTDVIGAGGYGTVTKVKIPAGYHISRSPIDAVRIENAEDEVIACKQIAGPQSRVWKDFKKEVENLSFIRKSITSHSHIMNHIGFLVHNDRCFILLPLAEGDLEQFLTEGKAEEEDGQRIQKSCSLSDMVSAASPLSLLQQASYLASALEWLHHRLESPGDEEASCVHMDLKPSNILIFKDSSTEESSVGCWKLSDFGISVINRTSDSESRRLSIICDLNEPRNDSGVEINRSGHTPQRCAGTYQAPEVQKGNKHTVGRKSDVWSLACIFCEIFAFCLGKGSMVSSLRNAKAVGAMDCYYVKQRQHIGVPWQSEYQPSPEILKWVAEQTESASPEHWARKSAQIIHKYLVVQYDHRPGVDKFAADLRQLVSYRDSISSEPIQGSVCGNSRTANLRPCSQSLRRLPHGRRRTSESTVAGILSTSSSSQSSRLSTRASSTGSLGSSTPLERSSTCPSHSPYPDQSATARQGPRSLSLSQLPHHLFLPRSYVETSMESPQFLKPRKGDLVATQKTQGAWLVNDSIFTCSIFPGRPLTETRSTRNPIDIRWRYPISVPTDIKWKYIAVSDELVAIAGDHKGSSNKSVYVYLLNTRDPTPYKYRTDSLSTLSGLALSATSDLLLVSHGELRLLRFQFSSPIEPIQEKVFKVGRENHNFDHAAFSPSGDLYAWSWGCGDDIFHMWRYHSAQNDWQYEYISFEKNRGGIQANVFLLLPFESFPGCVVKTGTNQLFCAASAKQPVYGSPAKRYSTEISDIIIATVVADEWLLTVEPHWKPRYKKLKCYLIYSDGEGTKVDESPKKLGKLESNITPDSRIEFHRYEHCAAAVICNQDGTIEVVWFSFKASSV